MIISIRFWICSKAHWFSCIDWSLVSAIETIINLLLGDTSTPPEEVRIQLISMDHGVNGVSANAHYLCDLGWGKIGIHSLLDKFW